MKTEKGFVVRFSKEDRNRFCWFVAHPLLDGTKPIARGDLEAHLNKCRLKLLKIERGRKNGK